MKNIFLILFLTLLICYAQAQKSSAILLDYDSLKVIVSDLDKRQKEIKNSIDSLNGKFISDNFAMVKSIEKMQELHNKAFDKMQNSFSIFLTAVSIITGVLAIFIGVLVLVNFKSVNNSKDEFEKISNKAKYFDEKIKEHDESISNLKKSTDVFMENKGNLKEKEKKELKEMAEYVKNNPNASEYEKALAGAATYYYDNNYKSALESYKVILKNYGDKITLTRLSQIYSQMAYSYDEIAQSRKNEDKEIMLLKAIDKYNQVLELNPKDVDAYYNFGHVLMNRAMSKTETKEKEGLLFEAIQKYYQALELNSKYIDAYYNLGYTLMRLAELKTETKEKEFLLNEAEDACLKSRNLGGDVYNLACVYAIKYGLKKTPEYGDLAFEYLEKSLEKKEQSFDYAENDSDFASLRDDPRYKKLKEKYGKK